MFLFTSSCQSPKIFLLCTKTDDVSEVLSPKVQSSILTLSKSLIQKVTTYISQVRNVFLVNKIFHTSSSTILLDGDPRTSAEDLRELLSAINDFSAKTEMLIPNNWKIFGGQL